ncbi:MAG: radical SAM/Cys-rich domain protein [Planctomycetes bacterium]|nr:radical SAM/Cys-rich domain protein [Planctomycetota bacterium]
MTTIPLTISGRTAFDEHVESASGKRLRGLTLDTVQVNIGLRCNLACRHCHVESSPKREEQMDWTTMLDVLNAARHAGAATLDITGGAPEMNPDFRRLVDAALAQRLHVMVRTNLTIMLQPGYEDLPEWYAERGIHLIASLPCYLPTNVDRQRGRHVYEDSVEVIRRLNRTGYGRDADKPLDLVYNPLGPALPPPQPPLEQAYREALRRERGLEFNKLYTITNIPIGRFLHDLARQDKAEAYRQLLREAFNPGTLDGLMCRHQLHVGYDGMMYDCDFNYAMGITARNRAQHIRDFDPGAFVRRVIATGDHCFACTAGCGSSCGGALIDGSKS